MEDQQKIDKDSGNICEITAVKVKNEFKFSVERKFI